ncbi:MAG: radical SAM family heme chaperone HemW [Candidatus Marinimicrobia bacterium]|nr:radical SAM family heme chaperone HemW [Candidatus Neomarinimicrobiota bacterium]
MVENRHNTELGSTSGIYLHVPFCKFKCPYCDFYSIESGDEDKPLRTEFVQSLLKEIESTEENVSEVGTIYFGGGTPSILNGGEMESIFAALRSKFSVKSDAEITVEVNPGEVDLERLSSYYSSGVNRLSIGAQSFKEEELKTLGRIHSPEEISDTVSIAISAGFNNYNLDLIYAVPGQTVDSVLDNVNSAATLKPNHISVYSLTYEKSTPYYSMKENGELNPIDGKLEEEMRNSILVLLKEEGYHRYEISSYSLEGYESKHNSAYWGGASYIGFGPSAHSFDGKRRWWNVRDVNKYNKIMKSGESPVAGSEELNKEQLMFERIFLALRTSFGLEIRSFEKEFNFVFGEKYKSQMEKIKGLSVSQNEELITYENDRVVLTEKGLLFADEISELFAP